MWNLPKGTLFLPSTSMRRLQQLYDAEPRAKPKLRLLCAINRKRGRSIDDIADRVNRSRITVHSWLRKFHVRGIAGKDSIKQSGRPPQLTTAQRRTLIRELERGPSHTPSGLWSTKQVRELIRKKYGVAYAPQHVWRLLVACGFSLLRPRQRHYKSASPDEKLRFKKKRDARQGTTERKDLLWARKMRPHSASFRSLRAAGRAKEANPLQS